MTGTRAAPLALGRPRAGLPLARRPLRLGRRPSADGHDRDERARGFDPLSTVSVPAHSRWSSNCCEGFRHPVSAPSARGVRASSPRAAKLRRQRLGAHRLRDDVGDAERDHARRRSTSSVEASVSTIGTPSATSARSASSVAPGANTATVFSGSGSVETPREPVRAGPAPRRRRPARISATDGRLGELGSPVARSGPIAIGSGCGSRTVGIMRAASLEHLAAGSSAPALAERDGEPAQAAHDGLRARRDSGVLASIRGSARARAARRRRCGADWAAAGLSYACLISSWNDAPSKGGTPSTIS